jgi:Zn-dependent protease with chaperone function
MLSAAARRLDSRLGASMAVTDLEPKLTGAKVAAYFLAALVYLVALLFIVGGITLAAITRSLVGIVFGAALVGFGIIMRPRFGPVPTEGVVPREETPTLHELCDEIATALGTHPPSVVIIGDNFDAWWSIRSFRRKRVLALGLPLLSILEPQERVALIAHELAHGRNGDATRGFIVGGALEACEQLEGALTRREDSLSQTYFAFAELLSYGFLWLVSRPLVLFQHTLWLLLLRDCHRAEYFADALAARVAGSDAEIALDEKLLLHSVFETVAMRSARGEGDLFADLRSAIDDVPERERERRRRMARMEGVRLTSTHPPTGRRLELIEARPQESGQVFLSDERSAKIDRELQSVRTELRERLAEDYRSALYYG